MIYNNKKVYLEVSRDSLRYDYTPNSDVPEEFKKLALDVTEGINKIVLERTFEKEEVGRGKIFAAANSKPINNAMIAGYLTTVASGITAIATLKKGFLSTGLILTGVTGASYLAASAVAIFKSLINGNKRAYKYISDDKPRNKYSLVVMNNSMTNEFSELTQFSQSVIEAVPSVLRNCGFSKQKSKAVKGDTDYTFSKKGKNGNIYLAVMDNNLRRNTSTIYLLCVKDNEKNSDVLNEAYTDKFVTKKFLKYIKQDSYHNDKEFGNALLNIAKDLKEIDQYKDELDEIQNCILSKSIPSSYTMYLEPTDEMDAKQLKAVAEKAIKKQGFSKNASVDLSLSQDKDVDFKTGYISGESIEYVKKLSNGDMYAVVLVYGHHPHRRNNSKQDKKPNYITSGRLDFYRIPSLNVKNKFANLELI